MARRGAGAGAPSGRVLDLPKVELHLHLDLSMSFEVAASLCPGLTVERYRRELQGPARCADLATFLVRTGRQVELLQGAAALELLTTDVVAGLAAEQVVHAELRFAPMLHTQAGMHPRAAVEAVTGAAATAASLHGMSVGVILSSLRHLSFLETCSGSPMNQWGSTVTEPASRRDWSTTMCDPPPDPNVAGGWEQRADLAPTEPARPPEETAMLDERQEQLCSESRWDFSDLRAIYLGCSLKPSPEPSHTDGLFEIARAVMERNGVTVDVVRAVDHDLPPGVYPDMRDHGFATDGWPDLFERVMAADIVVLGTPIWLGEKSSVCTRVVERLYGNSAQLNDDGQYAYYGRVGGCIVTGNEDGAKHCAMNVLYSLQHLGFTIPPQADAAWLGEAGPGPSYLDPGSGGPENDFTNRNTTFMAWNLLHLARMLRDAGGIPAHGNQRSAWDAGCRHDLPNPEHR